MCQPTSGARVSAQNRCFTMGFVGFGETAISVGHRRELRSLPCFAECEAFARRRLVIPNAGVARAFAASRAADPSRFAKTAAREGRHASHSVQKSSVVILPEPEKTWFYCSKTQVFENAHVWRNFRQISPSSFLRCFMAAVVRSPAPGSS